MDLIREEIEMVLAKHAIPASRDRLALGVLIEHMCVKLSRKLEDIVAAKIKEQNAWTNLDQYSLHTNMGSEPSRLSRRVPQEDLPSWTESLSSSQSVAWATDTDGHDVVDSTISHEKLTHFQLQKSAGAPVFFLSLAFEDLTSLPGGKIPDELLNSVTSLDLTNNRFENVQFLAEFESLTTISLDHNRIGCLTAFPKLPKLHSLSLNFNRILYTTPFIPSLALQCPNLRFLSLMANEVCPNYLNGGTEQQNEMYRNFVIRHFPKLEYLDDAPVTSVERRRALDSQTTQGYQCSLDEGIDTE